MFGNSLNAPEATVIAACVAALVSLLVVTANIFNASQAEKRSSYRKVLEPYLSDLGRLLYGSVATSMELLKKKKGTESYTTWRVRADTTAQDLNEMRAKIRYPLWGLDKAIRILTRLSNWVEHKRDDTKEAHAILDLADALRRRLDGVVHRCFMKGRPPNRWEIWWVNLCADKLHDTYKQRSGSTTDNGTDNEDEADE